jgi:hypothetical protein
MVTMSEALRPDQGVREIDEERDRQDELQEVGEAHTRSSHATSANAAAKNTTVRAIISTSSIRTPCLPSHSKARTAGVKDS